MMNDKISIVLVGIGGYGQTYAEALLKGFCENNYVISGVVDPYPEKCDSIEMIRNKGIPVFSSMEDYYANLKADLAVISTPPQFHCRQICLALSHGANVLCEKPLCAVVQDAYEIIRERDRTGKFVAIGYQWSYSEAILELKRDILAGVLGKPRRLKTIVLSPRNEAYYKRAEWAGRKKDTEGNWILDSVAGNAAAHYLHNMFYILGDRIEESISLEGVVAELYRVNEIENYDTAAARIFSSNGVEILFFASHATENTVGPMFHYEFDKAKVIFETDWEGNPYKENREVRKGNIWALFSDGSYKVYGNPNKNELRKLASSINAVTGAAEIACGPEASIAHTLCINGMQESMRHIQEMPKSLVNRKTDKTSGEGGLFVQGLEEILMRCYENCRLPSEDGIPWAKAGSYIDLREYKQL